MDEFEATAKFLGQRLLGGKCTRWQSQGDNGWPTLVNKKFDGEWGTKRMSRDEYDEELEKIDEALEELQDGNLQRDRRMGPMDLKGIDSVGALSFPSLAIFTQLVSTIKGADPRANDRVDCSINRAITAEIDMKHVQTFVTPSRCLAFTSGDLSSTHWETSSETVVPPTWRTFSAHTTGHK